MGSKGYRLWVMGQLDSNVQSPHHGVAPPQVRAYARLQAYSHVRIRLDEVPPARGVAVQAEFVKQQTLKPGFSLHRFKG
jgi:hypothetical protein